MSMPSRTGRLLIGAVGATALAASMGGLTGVPAATGAGSKQLTKHAPVDPKAGVTPGKPLTKRTTAVTLNATATVAPAAADTDKVGVRALVVADDATDWGLATYRRTLDRIGAQYDVFNTATDGQLTAASLVAADGTGKYNAVLLTNATQNGLDSDEFNVLWAYERDYGIRQATLYASWYNPPEDYCLGAGTESGAPTTATLTGAGDSVFSYLKGTAQVPITDSYVYSSTANTSGCNATPVLQDANGGVLGVKTVSIDGRERMAFTFTSNENLLQSDLLVYGLFRWASRGVFLGEQRHYLGVDVDDWFNSSDHRLADGTFSPEEFQMSAKDAYSTSQSQKRLRAQYPLASQFKLHLAYNGSDADLTAGTTCYPNGGVAKLTATTRCLANQFDWINHTYSHEKLNFSDYTTTYNEIEQNIDVARRLGLSIPTNVLKTGEYSGLGTYNDDPTNDIDPPTDHGLEASNPNLLSAAKALGIKYLHGNMSFKSQVPACFDCGTVHPLEPSLMVVPDWPTNIAYFSTDPAEETQFYNSFYGPNGKFPYWPTDLTYDQALDYETSLALLHVTSGSIYSHTFHIANLRNYDGAGSSLVFDWVNAAVMKYSALYDVPLLTPTWAKLAATVADRNKHFNAIQGDKLSSVVYDRSAKTITLTSKSATKVTLSGVTSDVAGSSRYGDDTSAPITLKPKTPLMVAVNPLP